MRRSPDKPISTDTVLRNANFSLIWSVAPYSIWKILVAPFVIKLSRDTFVSYLAMVLVISVAQRVMRNPFTNASVSDNILCWMSLRNDSSWCDIYFSHIKTATRCHLPLSLPSDGIKETYSSSASRCLQLRCSKMESPLVWQVQILSSRPWVRSSIPTWTC